MPKLKPILFNLGENIQFYELLQSLNPNFIPHVLSLGCGYDSIALLIEYILNPDSRDFPLENLVVVHAVVGGEAAELKKLMEEIILPLMRQHNIWFIQACRNGDSEADGITILSSTRQPSKFYLRGDFELFTHLIVSGTVPQRGGSGRLCTIKFKGWVIDLIAQALFKDSPRKRFIGFNADESKRTKEPCYADPPDAPTYLIGFNADETGRLKDRSFGDVQPYHYEIGFNADEAVRIKEDKSRKQVFRFPLIEMGFGRLWCENRVNNYVSLVTNGRITRWRKSYCTNCCPFPECNGRKRKRGNNTDGDLRQDWLDEPLRGAEAALIEHIALAVNENQPLYINALVIDILRDTENHQAIALYEQMLRSGAYWVEKVIPVLQRRATPEALLQAERLAKGEIWAVYCVRRMFVEAKSADSRPPAPYRQTRILYQGDRQLAEEYLSDLAERYGQTPEMVQLSWRFWTRTRPEGKKPPRPYCEEMFVVCPASVLEKMRVTQEQYDLMWLATTGELPCIKGVDRIYETKPTNDRVRNTRIRGQLRSAK